MRFSKFGLSLFLFWFSVLSHADIVTGLELLAVAKEQLTKLGEQYKTLKNTYDTTKQELANLKEVKASNQGHYGFGNLDNGLEMLKERQWSPNSWDDALNNIAGGNPARYKALVHAYERNHKTLDEGTYKKGASDAQYALYKESIAVNKAVSVESTYIYNDINKHLKKVHDLSLQIEQAKNTKSAIDLNSRLLAEIAYIQTENLKMQSLISQQLTQTTTNDIAIDSQIAAFNRLPDE